MISIIIPTFNEERLLPKLLDSIKRQTYRDYEVIVADAASRDRTHEIAEAWGARVVEGGTPAAGRNAGARAARGQYLLFLDADVILPVNFLRTALSEFNTNYFEIATPTLFPISDLNIDKIIFFFANLIIESTQDFYSFAPGAGILVTRRLHERIRGFNETLKMSEDHDYVERAREFAKYGVLKNAYLFLSVRRLDHEGRLNLLRKYFLLDVYRFINKKVDKQMVQYEFGDFHKVKGLNAVEKTLEQTITGAQKLSKAFKKFADKMKQFVEEE
ncbi:MAG: glycosyltransferase [Patescibacteria group bacterium]|nr:glycosyltransferase [Patescibacteria group bacterium]